MGFSVVFLTPRRAMPTRDRKALPRPVRVVAGRAKSTR
ncbi:hypothetical protein BN2537_5293 [Streptomyces venezuelae]|nr:hypothetical protein BN2537_5293 [Streptomyces venezuelae]